MLKGICIVIIVMMHCDLLVGDDVSSSVTPLRVVPLYFFLSGLFFKPYANFREFGLRMIDTLVVPYLFFQALLGGILLAKIVVMQTRGDYFADELIRIATIINGPLWFLRCLFLINLGYYVLVRLVKNRWRAG